MAIPPSPPHRTAPGKGRNGNDTAHNGEHPTNGNGHGNGRNGNGHGNGNGPGGGGYGYGYGYGAVSAKEQLYEILYVIFKNKRKILFAFLAVFGTGALMALLKPSVFVATAKVIISTDRADLTIQPTDLTSLTTLKLNESAVNSEVHVIRSRELMETVVRGLRTRTARGGVLGIANAAGDEEKLGQQAVTLANALKVNPIRASNVIQIDYASRDQTYAAQVVNTVIDEYLAYHALVHSQRNLSRFYDEQSDLLEQNLQRAEEALREFAQREKVVSPESELRATMTSLRELEDSLRQTNASIAATEERLRVIREQLAAQPALVKRMQVLDVNPVVKQLTEHLVDRRVDRVALLRKYTEKDRHLRDNAEEITEIETQLNQTMQNEPTVVSRQVFRANPIYDAQLTRLLDLEGVLKADRARKLSEEDDIARSRRQLVDLKQKALEFDRLEHEVQRRRATLELYEKRGQEARISDAMDQEKLVNVKVVQKAAPPLPRTDRRGTSLLFALLSGLVVSLGGAFVWEYLNRRIRFERDVERHLGLPVLGSIADASQA
jgi:uncharacterized protein involved in exopolysaccharide biosynthesis